jgi:hypothetical protein
MMDFSPDPYIAENQMKAIVASMVAFGYIDSSFDPIEKEFVRAHIRKLVDHRVLSLLNDEAVRQAKAREWTEHFYGVLDDLDRLVQRHFAEPVPQGETHEQFVLAKLKLWCFELLKRFDPANQQAILGTIDELIRADGVIHPEEQKFRDEMVHLLEVPVPLDDEDLVPVAEGELIVDQARCVEPRHTDHPLLLQSEWDFATDPDVFAKQCEGDMELVARVMGTLAWQRSNGNGRLGDAFDFSAFATGGAYAEGEPFLDEHVYVLPAKAHREIELLVVGDLHGCYSCLKAALMQADFFTKVEAHERDPQNTPAIFLVLLGDYIDRGRFSYAGTLRAVMQLYLKWPDRVFMLRGNHEFYIEHKGRVLAPVRPAEAMESLVDVAHMDVFVRYMKLFEALPNMLVFDRTLFVHGGIPRQDTWQQKYKGLSSLNDPEIRFQMMWSDPSDAEAIPLELQQENARFPFGRKQFQHFMTQIGCRTLFRGHERVTEGFRQVYDGPGGSLFTLFSAGGATNGDLPPDSTYREVAPIALSIRHRDGVSTIAPMLLDYARYNDPQANAFFRQKVGE